jgi:regulator of sigma D
MYTTVDSHLPDGNNQLSSPEKCRVKRNVDVNRQIGNCGRALKTTRDVLHKRFVMEELLIKNFINSLSK